MKKGTLACTLQNMIANEGQNSEGERGALFWLLDGWWHSLALPSAGLGTPGVCGCGCMRAVVISKC